MFSDASLIDPVLAQAYRETEYMVWADRPFGDQPFVDHPFVVRVGDQSPDLLDLYRSHQVDCCLFITACNPYSQKLADAENGARRSALARELEHAGLVWLPGEGKHPSGDWPAEPSFLVLGVDLDASKSMGMRLEQNAVIWCGADAIPALVLLR